MCSLWILSILGVFVVGVRTGTLLQKDLLPRRCQHCFHNATVCARTAPVVCPVGQPYCATVASAPDFTSLLTCAAASEFPCSLKYKTKLEVELICTCPGHLCNAPYTSQLRNELLNFSTKFPANTSAELGETFFKSSIFVNVTKTELYKMITEADVASGKPSFYSTRTTTIGPVSISISENMAPRAEALKHEATVPPDDDEDEGEGSGAFEDSRLPAPAAPAAPSSYLPAEQNQAPSAVINVNLLFITSFYLRKVL